MDLSADSPLRAGKYGTSNQSNRQMPIYDYECRTCGAEFDLLRRVSDDDRDVECPRCKEKNAQRKLSLTAADAASFKSACGSRGRYTRFG